MNAAVEVVGASLMTAASLRADGETVSTSEKVVFVEEAEVAVGSVEAMLLV